VKDILFVDEVLGQHGKKVRGVFISFSLFYAFTANPIHSALEIEKFWISPNSIGRPRSFKYLVHQIILDML
jgi:hypothetical protein